MKMVHRGLVQESFSARVSLVAATKSQDHLIKTIEILRAKYHYRGYVHLKVMPGAEEAQIERSMELCDRVSINLEGLLQNG